MTKIILHGACGAMGKVIRRLAEADGACVIAAGVDVNQEAAPFPIFNNIFDCGIEADVIIDFSTAGAVDSVVEFAAGRKIALVECTTSLNDATVANLQAASEKTAVFRSANMSVCVNLMANLVATAASALLGDSKFDVEIVEKHHAKKIDAPSGTAIMLANAVNDRAGGKYSYVTDRANRREVRPSNEIGIHAVRGGTVVGEHSVFFFGGDEVIEIKHNALSKEVFAAGAIRAAKYLSGKPAGLYDMADLIQDSIN
jgi:4-hydroxy-tetrahydrodipicolinate reductase